jgi:CelD/BcsL family acetyltransferase involved in cellulose biosynthesis
VIARIEAIVDGGAFQALEPEWNVLLRASSASNVFLSWEWVSLWWNIYGRGSRLHILTARDATGALVGIAPLKRRGLGLFGVGLVDVAEFIGTGGEVTPERLDFIVRRGDEPVVTAALAEAVCRDRSLAGIDLRPFAGDSPNLPIVLEVFQRNRRTLLRTQRDSVCPVMALPPTWAEFLSSRSRNYRKKIGEYERRCARDFHAVVRLSATEAEVARDMSVLIDLHLRRWGRESRAFQTREYVAFHRQFARRMLQGGHLRLFVLESDSTPLAALYCFALDGRYYYYQAGRDPERSQHRPGLVLLHAAIKHAIEEGIGVFDFLTGAEAYKYTWAAGEHISVRVTDWRTRPMQAVGYAARLLDSATHDPPWRRELPRLPVGKDL